MAFRFIDFRLRNFIFLYQSMTDDYGILIEEKVQQSNLSSFDRNSQLVDPIAQIFNIWTPELIPVFLQQGQFATYKRDFAYLFKSGKEIFGLALTIHGSVVFNDPHREHSNRLLLYLICYIDS